MELSEVKITIRALLMSCKDGLTVMQLMKDFKSEEGSPVPFKEFGFDNVFDFLLSIPDVLTFQRNSSPHMGSVLLPVASSKTSHLAELVAGQKNNQKKRSKSMPRPSFYDKFKSQHNYSQTYGSPRYNAPREQSQWQSKGSSRPYTPNRTSEYHHHNSNEHYSKRYSEKTEDRQSHSKFSPAPQNDMKQKENDYSRSRPSPRSRSSPNHLEYKSSTHETDCTAETSKYDNSTNEISKAKPSVPSSVVSHTTPNKSNSQLTANVPPKSNSQTNNTQTNSTENQSTSTNPAKPSASNQSVSEFLSRFTQKPQSAPPQPVTLPALTQQACSPRESFTHQPSSQGSHQGAAVFKSVPNPIQSGAQSSQPRYLQQMNTNVPTNPQYNIDHIKLNDLMNARKCGLLPTPLQNISNQTFNAARSIQQAPWNMPHLSQQGYLTNNMTQPPPQHVPLIPQSSMSMQQSPLGSYLNQQLYGYASQLNQPSYSNTSLHNQSPLTNMIQNMNTNVSSTNFGSPGLDLSYVMQHRIQRAALTSSAKNRPSPSSEKFTQPLVPPGFEALYPQHSLMTSQGNQQPVNMPFEIPIPGDVSMDSERSLPSRPPSVLVSSSSRPASSSMLDDPDEAYVKSLLESSATEKDGHSFQARKKSSTSETPATLKMLENLNKSAHHSRPASPTSSSRFTCSTPTPSMDRASTTTSERVDREILFVGKRMRENLIALRDENPEGIRCSQLPNLYETKYKVPLKYREYGTPSMFSFVDKLPTVFKIVDLSSGEDWMLFDPEKEIPAKYLHRDLIPAAIEEALLKILRRCRNGFFLDEFKAKYQLYYQRPINLQDYPAFSWTDVVAHFSVAKKLARVTQVGPRWFFRPLSKDAHLQPEHNLPAIPPGWELLKPQIAHYESTYVLKMDQLSKVKLPDVSKYEEVPIILQDGLSPHNLSAILANNKTSLDEMMDDLNEVYKALGEEELDMERAHITRGNVCMARYNATDWHRCKILRVMDDARVKLLFLDFGTVDYAPFSHLKYMMRDYSVLPIQCVYVSLYRVQPVNTDPQTGLPVWDRRGTDKLLNKYDNVTVNATVFQYNTKEPRISCWITFLEADAKVAELNREYCEWGYGALDLSSIPSSLQMFEEIPIPGDDDFQDFLDRISRPAHIDPEPDSDEIEEDNSAARLPDKPAPKKKIFSSDSEEEEEEEASSQEEKPFSKVPPVLSSILRMEKEASVHTKPAIVPQTDKIPNTSRPGMVAPSNKILNVTPPAPSPPRKVNIPSPAPSTSRAKLPPVCMEYSPQHRIPLPVMPVAPSTQNPPAVMPVPRSPHNPPAVMPVPRSPQNPPAVMPVVRSSSHYPSYDTLPSQQPLRPAFQNVAPPIMPSRANIGVVPEDAQLMEVTYRRRDGFQVTETYMGDLANHPYANQQPAATGRSMDPAHHQLRSNRRSLDNLTDDSLSDTDRNSMYDRGALPQPLIPTSVPRNNVRPLVPNPAQLSNQHLNNHPIITNPVQLSNQYSNNNPPTDLNPTRLCNPLLNNNLGGALSNLRTPTLELKAILDNIALGVSKNANTHAGNKVLNSSSAALAADQTSEFSELLINQTKNQVLPNVNQISHNMSGLSVRSNEILELSNDYSSGNNHPVSRNIQNESIRENSYSRLPPGAVLTELSSRNHAMLRDTINENAIYKDSANRIDMEKENDSESVKRKVYKTALHETLTPTNAPVEKNLFYAGANAILDSEKGYNMNTENVNEPLRRQDNRSAEWFRQNSTNRKYDHVSYEDSVKPLNTQPSNKNIQSAPSARQGSVSSVPCSSIDNALEKNMVSLANSSAPYRPPHYHLHSLSSDINDPATTGNPSNNLNSQPSVPTRANSLNANSDEFFPKKFLNPVSEEFVPEQVSTKCKHDNVSQTQSNNMPIQNIANVGHRGHQIPNETDTIYNKQNLPTSVESGACNQKLPSASTCGEQKVLNHVEAKKSDSNILNAVRTSNVGRPTDTNTMGSRTKEIPIEIPASQFSTKQTDQPLIELPKVKTNTSLEIPPIRKPSTTSQEEGGSVKSDDTWLIRSKCKYFVNIRRLENPLTTGCENFVSLRAVVVNKTPLNVVVLGGPLRACLIVEQFAHHVLKTSSVNVLLKTLRSQDQEAILVKHTRDGSPALFEWLAGLGRLPRELENSLYLMEVRHLRSSYFQLFRKDKDLMSLQEELAEFFT